ncbi:hypothetical protein [Streptomyces sp. NPDC058157]|uniref:hypothetical protein n=1 Tax=Streptomyces sp. NPDC058157 TaxID=3346360 RepID=UPI0036E40251
MDVDGTEAGATPAAHRLQSALAVAAAVIAVPVTVWGFTSGIGALFVVTCLATTLPLLTLRRPQHLVATCVGVGLGLLAWGVLGVMFAMFVYWPSALLLLCAALADPRQRPVIAKVAGGLGAAVGTAALAGYAAFVWYLYIAPALAEPHTYRAVTQPGIHRLEGVSQRLIPLGATGVTETDSWEGSYMDVRFQEHLTASEREKLRTEITRLPGITKVDLCPVSACG